MTKHAGILALTLVFFASTAAFGQDVTLSWQSDTTRDFGQQPSGTITINLKGTNPFFYTYGTDIRAVGIGQDDATTAMGAIFAAQTPKVAGAAAPVPDPCAIDAAKILPIISGPTAKLTLPGTPPKSIAYSTTAAEWNANIGGPAGILGSPGPYSQLNSDKCTTDQGAAAKEKIEKSYADLFPSHDVPTFVTTIQAKDCTKYTVAFREFYNGSDTGQTATATFTTSCEQLTLSAGTILTELPSPTYSSVTDPANTQQQRLSVQNTGGLRPTIVGLMNYNIWSGHFWTHHNKIYDLPWAGLAVSTGPVFQNAQSNASVFGWYLGGSVSVHKRLFVTFGEHWGQVPGTPYGLAQGTVIPANYGQLNPQLHYSGRFALGITFQTTSFSGIGQKSAAPSVAAQPAGK